MTVDVQSWPGRVRIVVSDNEQGLDTPWRFDDLVSGGRLGLAGMHERVRTLGGTLTIESEPSRDTVLAADVPLQTRPDSGDSIAHWISWTTYGCYLLPHSNVLPVPAPDPWHPTPFRHRYPSACRLNSRAYVPPRANNSSWLPISVTCPSSSTAIQSAIRTVENRWEMSSAIFPAVSSPKL